MEAKQEIEKLEEEFTEVLKDWLINPIVELGITTTAGNTEFFDNEEKLKKYTKQLWQWINTKIEAQIRKKREGIYEWLLEILGYTVEEMQNYGVNNVSELQDFLREHMRIF